MTCFPKYLTTAVLLSGILFAADAPSIWVDVPFVKQNREGCGAASIAMVMQYWTAQAGRPPDAAADSASILQQLHSSEGHGIYASAMRKYFDEHGYRTFAFSGTWHDLEEHLRKGRPLIVSLAPSGRDKVLHYVVVAGLDGSYVMFNDPADRKLARLDRKTFEKQWRATDNWTLLAVPQSPAVPRSVAQ